MSVVTKNFDKPYYEMAGVRIPLSRAVMLTANATGSAIYDTLRSNSGTGLGTLSQYQVPAGKKLFIRAIKVLNMNGANPTGVAIGSANATATNTSSAPDGFTTSQAGGNYSPADFTPTTQYSSVIYPCHYEISAGKYPYVFTAGGSLMCIALGELVDV